MFKANELKAELIKRGLSLSDLAKILGITERSVYNKINELNDWTYKELLCIRALFGVKTFNNIFFE